MPTPTRSVYGDEPKSRRERKKLETRGAILDAALALMTGKGYDAVTIDDIARRADIANATFFLHFPTKASLLVAFNDQISAKVAERLHSSDLGAVEKIERVLSLLQDEWTQHEELLRKLVTEGLVEERGALINSINSLARLVADIVRDGQRGGELSLEFEADIIARSLIGAWRATTLDWTETGDIEQARKDNRCALDLILKGALPR